MSGSRASSHGALRGWTLLAVALVAAACSRTNVPAGPSPLGSPLPLPALKLAVLDAVGGHLAYCDPDQYPVAHGDALETARARLPTIRADRAAFDAILQKEGLSAGQRFTPAELVAINTDYKQLQAIGLQPAGDAYRFSVLVPQTGSDVGTWRVSGTVDRTGTVTIERRVVGKRPMCPICLAAGVRIATPIGDVPVQDLRAGMPMWTVDLHGWRVAAVVLRTGHMEAPIGHEVIRLALADGRVVTVSPGHPTADGHTVGDLEPGDRYAASVVRSAHPIPYVGTTWDLLPSGPTGWYFADGVPLASTLSPPPA